MVSNSLDEVNFPHRLLVTDKRVVNLCKALTNDLLANIKLSKTQLSKIIVRWISWLTYWTVTKNLFSSNKKCTYTIKNV